LNEEKMKKFNSYLKEYLRNLNQDDFDFVYTRLDLRCPGDLAEVIDYLDRKPEFSKYFKEAKNANDFYDLIDNLYVNFQKENSIRISEK
jgi:hypothetical protein